MRLVQQKQHVRPKWLQRASWLVLLSLAWIQLAFAAHQFEHSATHLEFCAACVQLERFDGAVAPTAQSLELLRPECEAAIPGPAAPSANAVTAGFDPRAPPVT